MQLKTSIRFYNDREVRAVWDEEHNKWLIIPITTRRIDLQFGLQYFLHHNNIFVFMAAGKPIFFYANLLKIGTSE